MYDNYHFPLGADTPSAPWNERTPPEKEFEVTCSQSLSKTVPVYTDNYIPVTEKEFDGENYIYEQYADTECTDWKEEYHDNGHHTPLQLIELFGKYLQDELEGTQNTIKSRPFLKSLMEECADWIEDECEYVEN